MMLGSERWLICCFMSFLFLMSAAALSAGGDVFGFDWGLGGLCFLYHFCCYFLSCRLHFVLVPSWIGGMASGSLHSFLYGAFLSLSFTIFLVSGRISEGLTLVVAFVLCPSFLFSFDLVTKSKPYRDCFFWDCCCRGKNDFTVIYLYPPGLAWKRRDRWTTKTSNAAAFL